MYLVGCMGYLQHHCRLAVSLSRAVQIVKSQEHLPSPGWCPSQTWSHSHQACRSSLNWSSISPQVLCETFLAQTLFKWVACWSEVHSDSKMHQHLSRRMLQRSCCLYKSLASLWAQVASLSIPWKKFWARRLLNVIRLMSKAWFPALASSKKESVSGSLAASSWIFLQYVLDMVVGLPLWTTFWKSHFPCCQRPQVDAAINRTFASSTLRGSNNEGWKVFHFDLPNGLQQQQPATAATSG